MPSPTSLGITYPCETSLVDPADFLSHATSVETALSSVNALTPALLNRDFVRATAINPNVAVNVSTTVSWSTPSATNNPNGMFNAGTPTVFTLQSSGSFLVALHATYLNTPTTFTSQRGAVLLAGAEQIWSKLPEAGTAQGGQFWVSGHLVSAVAGQQVSCTYLWTGTGGPIQPFFDIQICKVSDL
jgi:hypothetical protein